MRYYAETMKHEMIEVKAILISDHHRIAEIDAENLESFLSGLSEEEVLYIYTCGYMEGTIGLLDNSNGAYNLSEISIVDNIKDDKGKILFF